MPVSQKGLTTHHPGGPANETDNADGTALPARLRPLAITAHFQRECPVSHLTLKITVPVSWESRSLREALVEPFMKAYAKKQPDAAAQLLAGPFELLRVESWAGPRPCAADKLEQRPNGHAAPQHMLLPVEEAVRVLRDVARISQHAWDKDAIEARTRPAVRRPALDSRVRCASQVEILAASSTALALQQTASHALVCAGERLNRMLSDPEAELGAMHALVDAALEQGGQAYLGLALARDGCAAHPAGRPTTHTPKRCAPQGAVLRRQAGAHAAAQRRDTGRPDLVPQADGHARRGEATVWCILCGALCEALCTVWGAMHCAMHCN